MVFELQFFKENNFIRKQCKNCKAEFFTKNKRQEFCGDVPCVNFSFIGEKVFHKKFEYKEMREKFLTFFEKRNHKRIERFPVIARWREDVFLVNASIYDFQPLVTNGLIPPPANPLCISQPCIRLNDIDFVGKTGRHLTTFEMMAHHCFNYKDKKIYWMNETVRYCDELLKELGIKEEDISYKEKVWVGGGNAGNALEVLSHGLELATLVFMNLKKDDNGKIELEGEKYSEMEVNVVDTGYGLERFVWLSKGTETIYDAIYAEFIKELTEISKIKNKENIYAIADHTRALAFMLGDGIIPSNVKHGYLTRLVIRKTLRMMEENEMQISLAELIVNQINSLDYPELKNGIETIIEILNLETERYKETNKKGKRLVENFWKNNKNINIENLVEFYDTYGIHPTVVKKFSSELGKKVEIPESFNSIVAQKHSKVEKEVVKEEKIELEETELLFYKDDETRQYTKEFSANVIYSKDNKIALDKTAFYPEGGGQLCDNGLIIPIDELKDEKLRKIFEQKKNDLQKTEKLTEIIDFSELQKLKIGVEVSKVEKIGNVILHTVDKQLKVGEKVKGVINWERRISLMRNHDATHLILGSTREVLGKHVWQSGAQKEIERARVDITHFKRITEEELRKIEFLANKKVLENLKIEKFFLEREIAEKQFGFKLYQGGVPIGKKIRIVKIENFDVEACAGTHCNSTAEIGLIKILKSERIQDGIERIEFSSGVHAIKDIQKIEGLLKESSSSVSVPIEELPKTINRFFKEWKEQKKEIEELKAKMVRRINENRKIENIKIKDGEVKLISEVSSSSLNDLIISAKQLLKEKNVIAILGSDLEMPKLIVASSYEKIDCNAIMKEIVKIIDGSGGGKKDFAQGGGKNKEKLRVAIEEGERRIRELLG